MHVSCKLAPNIMSITCLGSVYKATVISQFCSSIDSLLAGVSRPDEIVIVIDGPISSELDSVIQSYSKSGLVKTVRLPVNQGLGIALAAGMSFCSSSIICRFDTDDISSSQRIEYIRKAFEADSALDIFGSTVIEFSVNSNGRVGTKLKQVPLNHSDIINMMSFINPVNHPSVAFRKSSIQSVGGYRHMPFFEDYFLWLLAKRMGLRFRNVKVPLVFMRRDNLLSRRSGFKYALLEIRFYFSCLSEGLLNPLFAPFFALRCTSRLLPSFLQSFQSRLPWRHGYSPKGCPELFFWLSREKDDSIKH